MTKVWVEEKTSFILLSSILNQPGIGAEICGVLAEKDINMLSFIQISAPGKERTDVLIEVAEEDLPEASYVLRDVAKKIQARGLLLPNVYEEKLVTVAIRDPKLQPQSGIAAKIFKIFSKYHTNVWAFVTTIIGKESEIKILVEKRQLDEHPQIIKEIEKVL